MKQAIAKSWQQLSDADHKAIQARWCAVFMYWDMEKLNWSFEDGKGWTPSERGLA
jgi:hypothetical protein